VLPQQPLDAPQHARVIVHYQNKFAILRHYDLSADTSEALDAPGPTTLTHINALWFQTAKTAPAVW
jgi:hypothetical protein